MEIRPEFQVHRLNAEGMTQANVIAEAFSRLLAVIETTGCSGRDLALVKTKLEEACFVAKRGMASHPAHQEPV